MKILTRQVTDHLLFLYGLVISTTLILGSAQKLDSPTNLLTTLLFLPVTLYFLGSAALKIILFFQHFLNHDQPDHHRYFGHFSFHSFFDQTDPSFWIILILLSLALTLTLFKLSLTLIP